LSEFQGAGRGRGEGYGRRWREKGPWTGGGRGLGPEGYCICLRCGYRVPKQPGVPCSEMKCPNCGAVLVREGGYHHRLFLEKVSKRKK